ncbi:unnamed protein product, partial [Prunus brigantina]
MSNLIRSRKAVTTAQMSPPPTQPSATTVPAQMDHMLVDHSTGSPAPASSASSVAQPVSARRRHRPPSTTDTTSTDGTGASASQPAKKNTRGPCRQLKTTKVTRTNYKLEEIDEESLTYVHRLFGERYKQWKSDLHHHFQTLDDPQVALHEGCPQELEGREDSWAWLCGHFQEADYLTTMVEKSQLVLQESASQLPPDTSHESVDPPHDAGFQILTETLDQTLGRRLGTYCQGMGNAHWREPRARSASQSNSQVIALTA